MCIKQASQARLTVLLAMNSVSMSQQYILNKVPSTRLNTHKTRLYIGWLTECKQRLPGT